MLCTTIEMKGDMYECMFLEISCAQYLDLSKRGRDGDAWLEVEDDLMGESKINGFVYTSESASFSLLVNGAEQADLVRRFLSETGTGQPAGRPPKKCTGKKTYFIIFEKWCSQGQMYMDVSSYDPRHLVLSKGEVRMPDGTLQSVAECYYAGQDFHFGDSWTKRESLSLYCSDGTRVDIDY